MCFEHRLARCVCMGFVSVRGTSGTEPTPCHTGRVVSSDSFSCTDLCSSEQALYKKNYVCGRKCDLFFGSIYYFLA